VVVGDVVAAEDRVVGVDGGTRLPGVVPAVEHEVLDDSPLRRRLDPETAGKRRALPRIAGQGDAGRSDLPDAGQHMDPGAQATGLTGAEAGEERASIVTGSE